MPKPLCGLRLGFVCITVSQRRRGKILQPGTGRQRALRGGNPKLGRGYGHDPHFHHPRAIPGPGKIFPAKKTGKKGPFRPVLTGVLVGVSKVFVVITVEIPGTWNEKVERIDLFFRRPGQ
jgi:hypothetical protein